MHHFFVSKNSSSKKSAKSYCVAFGKSFNSSVKSPPLDREYHFQFVLAFFDFVFIQETKSGILVTARLTIKSKSP
jgi:hypothetical protein